MHRTAVKYALAATALLLMTPLVPLQASDWGTSSDIDGKSCVVTVKPVKDLMHVCYEGLRNGKKVRNCEDFSANVNPDAIASVLQNSNDCDSVRVRKI